MAETSTTRFPAACLAVSMTIFGTVGVFAVERAVTTVFWRCVFATLSSQDVA